VAPMDTMHHYGSTSDAAAHTEGTVARTIENQTAKLPSDTFLWLAPRRWARL